MRTRLLYFIAILFVSALFSGCALQKYTQLNKESLHSLSPLTVYGILNTNEIEAQIAKSGVSSYTGGGLIPALIDVAIDQKRISTMKKNTEQLKQEATRFNFATEIDKGLLLFSKELKLPNVKYSKVLPPTNQEARLKLFEDCGCNSILFVEMAYTLTGDYRRLIFGTTAYIMVKGQSDLKFYNNYWYNTADISNSKDVNELVALWSNNKAVKLHAALANGLHEILAMLQYDLLRFDANDEGINEKLPPLYLMNWGKFPCGDCRIIKNNNGRYMIRHPRGYLISSSDHVDFENEQQKIATESEKFKQEKEIFEPEKATAKEPRKLEEGKKQLAMAERPFIPMAKEIERDSRFIAYDNGTVLDTETNLMWASKDNGVGTKWEDTQTDWAKARSYCENYRGGGYTDWRMPTEDELARLFDKNITYQSECRSTFYMTFDTHLTELIRISCGWVWASETVGSRATGFDFCGGGSDLNPKSSSFIRALPVRSAK